jgi:hypothetical protein
VHKTAGGNGFLACVGLDRFLRLFDLKTRTKIGNIYCKTKMTSVLIIEGSLHSRSGLSTKRKKVAESSTQKADEDESDSVWAMLPEIAGVGNSNVKRRRLRVQEARSNAL